MTQVNKSILFCLALSFLNAFAIVQSQDIFKGGKGDGWASKGYAQPRVSIFKGGKGDGFAVAYRPWGPLSGVLAKFTAQQLSSKAALVTWKASAGINPTDFEVERSNDAVNFSLIGRSGTEGLLADNGYVFIDDRPLGGANYYRLKQVGPDGKVTYSPARLVQFANEVAGSIKYYPNPTNGILHIELNKEMPEGPMLINISNAAGIVVGQVKRIVNKPAVLLIDMKRFEKGVYFVQVKTSTINSTKKVMLQ